jgi:hypothetical protein
MADSPTSRSLAHMRKQGYTCEVVEKWVPGANIRKDLFGFVDIVCIRDNETVGVQSTSKSNLAARVNKIADHPNIAAVRKAGWKVVAHGWGVDAYGKWVLREVDCS